MTSREIKRGQKMLDEARREHRRRRTQNNLIPHKLRFLLDQLETGRRIEELIMQRIEAIHAQGLPAGEARERIEQLIEYCTTTLENEHPQFKTPAAAVLPGFDMPGIQIPPGEWRQHGQYLH